MRPKIFLPIILLSASFPLSAVDKPVSDREAGERIAHIQQKLDAGSKAASQWWWGWLGGYSAAAAGQLVAYSAMDNSTEDSKQLRENLLVGSVSCLLGVAGQFIDPMVPMYAGNELRSLPEGNDAERRSKLTRGEALLEASAKRERDGRSWLPHTLAFIVNLGSGLTVWQGFHQPLANGVLNLVFGTLVAEIQIFSQPTQAIDDWADYQRKYGKSSGATDHRPFNNYFINLGFGSFRAGVYF